MSQTEDFAVLFYTQVSCLQGIVFVVSDGTYDDTELTILSKFMITKIRSEFFSKNSLCLC